jgi:predicted Zn-dependent protease with MMP-like domain
MYDRHGRHRGVEQDRHRRPAAGFRTTGRQRFERLVTDAVSTLPPTTLRRLREVRLEIEEVPRSGEGLVLTVWDDPVAASLDRADPPARTGEETAELRLYRRPLEWRAIDRADLVELIREVVAERIADRFGDGDL